MGTAFFTYVRGSDIPMLEGFNFTWGIRVQVVLDALVLILPVLLEVAAPGCFRSLVG